MPIDMKTFYFLIVQLSYLLYTCKLKTLNLYLDKRILARIPKKSEGVPMQEVYLEYLLDYEYNRMEEK